MSDEDEGEETLQVRFSRSTKYFNLGLYPPAFEEAGEILTKVALETDQEHILFAPAIYVWRQAFELRMKRVIGKARMLSNAAPWGGKKKEYVHKLHELWKTATTLLDDLEHTDRSGFKVIESVVAIFTAEDPRGTAFRYAEGDGNVALYGEEFKKLTDAIREGCAMLYGICEGLDERINERDYEDGDYEDGAYEDGDYEDGDYE